MAIEISDAETKFLASAIKAGDLDHPSHDVREIFRLMKRATTEIECDILYFNGQMSRVNARRIARWAAAAEKIGDLLVQAQTAEIGWPMALTEARHAYQLALEGDIQETKAKNLARIKLESVEPFIPATPVEHSAKLLPFAKGRG